MSSTSPAPPPSPSSPSALAHLVAALALSAVIALFVEQRVFWDPFAVNDDVRNQIYWMARLVDPTLFPDDLIASYFSQPMTVSPLLSGLYALASSWIHPITLSQTLPFILVLLATLFLFKFAERHKNRVYAFWLCLAFNGAIWIFKNLAGGLSRAFFYPLFFLLLWQIQAGYWRMSMLTIWCAALLYPPVCLLGIALLGLEAWRAFRRPQEAIPIRRNYLWAWLGSFLGSLGVLYWRLWFFPQSPQFGPLTTGAMAERMQAFYQGGRVVLFPFSPHPNAWQTTPWDHVLALLERLPHLYILLPCAIVGILFLLYRRYGRPRLGDLDIPPLVWQSLLGSAFLYLLAWVSLFYLYVPERYLQYTLPLIPIFMVGGLLYRVQNRLQPHRAALIPVIAAVSLVIAGLFWREDLVNPSSDERQLYNYLKTVPKTALIAAAPRQASSIPVYAFRKTLISHESYIPFHQAYYWSMHTRLRDWLQANYSPRADLVRDFILKYNIDYLIVHDADFSPHRVAKLPHRYYNAFQPGFFTTLQQAVPELYYLNQVPAECIAFQAGGFKILDAKKLLHHIQHSQP